MLRVDAAGRLDYSHRCCSSHGRGGLLPTCPTDATLRRASVADSHSPSFLQPYRSPLGRHFSFQEFRASGGVRPPITHQSCITPSVRCASRRHLRYIGGSISQSPSMKGRSVRLLRAACGSGGAVREQRVAAVNTWWRRSATSCVAWARAGRHKWRGFASRRMAGRPCAVACSCYRLLYAERTSTLTHMHGGTRRLT